MPEVPFSPNDPLREAPAEPVADRVELSRIARYLHDEVGRRDQRREQLDVDAIRAAVCTVAGVRDARVRHHPNGVPTLRIELADDADAGDVTRAVTRLLKEQMGLAAAPSQPSDGSTEATVDPASAGPRLQRPYVTMPRPRSRPGMPGGGPARVVLDHVQVTTLGTDATVEVRLATTSGGYAVGRTQGPCVDGYLIRLAACSAADAVDRLLASAGADPARARCLVEHVAVVPFGVCEVAVVVLLLAREGAAEQLSGSAIVNGDPRHAVVRATLSAVNRRLTTLLP